MPVTDAKNIWEDHTLSFSENIYECFGICETKEEKRNENFLLGSRVLKIYLKSCNTEADWNVVSPYILVYLGKYSQ